MFLSDDVIYHILLWLPVISLLRFKSICRSWRVLIESSDFIKYHLHHHHYDPRLKDKNHNLIYRLPANDPPVTFSLTSIDSFEAPNVCLQLDCSDLLGYFPIEVYDFVSFNGIVCLNIYDSNDKQSICLWNPATKQSRFLPQSPFPPVIEAAVGHVQISVVGFGFDVRTNGYKVVNLIRSGYPVEKRVEVYDLSMDSWKSITTVFPVDILSKHPRMPFNNGTCFCSMGRSHSGFNGIFCFDFSTETFRSLSYPDAGYFEHGEQLSIVSDKIACVLGEDLYRWIQIWVFNEYGTVNESWAKLYEVDPYSTIDKWMPLVWHSMNGKYLFYKEWEQICRYNVVTKELKNVPTLEKYHEIFNGCPPPGPDKFHFLYDRVVEFKESLVSVGGGNDAAPACVNKNSKKERQ